jgi:hypothetical protein
MNIEISASVGILAAIFVTGFDRKNAGGIPVLGIEETKATTEEAFTYGVPIAMAHSIWSIPR